MARLVEYDFRTVALRGEIETDKRELASVPIARTPHLDDATTGLEVDVEPGDATAKKREGAAGARVDFRRRTAREGGECLGLSQRGIEVLSS
ncbi:MAG: hypothetical protein Q8R02_19070 [Hyphomonadaceae bacterium]|nr:hypothetical protein [Hyphomonadaceae bacterium]